MPKQWRGETAPGLLRDVTLAQPKSNGGMKRWPHQLWLPVQPCPGTAQTNMELSAPGALTRSRTQRSGAVGSGGTGGGPAEGHRESCAHGQCCFGAGDVVGVTAANGKPTTSHSQPPLALLEAGDAGAEHREGHPGTQGEAVLGDTWG